MSDEYLQQKDVNVPSEVMQPSKETQTLVLNTFLDERKKWEERKSLLAEEFGVRLDRYRAVNTCCKREPRWKKFLYNKVLRKSSPAEEDVKKALQELDNIAKKILEHDNVEPDVIRYELAAIGNNLFKPR